MTEEPENFGRSTTLAWKQVDGRPIAQAGAAFLQHTYALRIRRGVKARRGSLKSYALAVNTSYDRLMKMLRGDIVMRLEDIAMADWIVGGVSEFAVPDLPRILGDTSAFQQHELHSALERADGRTAERAVPRDEYAAILRRSPA